MVTSRKTKEALEILFVRAELPAEGEEREIAIPLTRPLTVKTIGTLTLLVR